MAEEVEHLIARPDSPNLYWALTQLPRPLIDMRTAIEGERLFAQHLFPSLRDVRGKLEKRIMDRHELEAIANRYLTLADRTAPNKEGPAAMRFFNKVGLSVVIAATYPEAKKFLRKLGIAAQRIDAMPVTQAVVLYHSYVSDKALDDSVKWYGTPYPRFRKEMAKVEDRYREALRQGDLTTNLIRTILPAYGQGLAPSYHLDRKIQGLRVVEALRMYAAKHGRWPNKLEDIKAVPVPNDPLTQAPFQYEVEGKTATIGAPVPPIDVELNKASRGRPWQYQLVLR